MLLQMDTWQEVEQFLHHSMSIIPIISAGEQLFAAASKNLITDYQPFIQAL